MSMSSHNDGDDIPVDTDSLFRSLFSFLPGRQRGLLPSSASCATYPSHVRNDDTPSCSLSKSKGLHDAQERVHLERDGAEHPKISATFSKDQGSKYAKEGEVTEMRDELQFRPSKEEDRYRYDGDRTDDKRDTPRGEHYSSLKEKHDVPRSPLARAKDTEPIAPASVNFQYVYEAQSKELSILRHEHRAAIEEQKRLANACVSLEQQCEERSNKLDAVRHERQNARMQRREIEDAYAVLEQQYEERTRELSAARRDAVEQKQRAEGDFNVLRHEHQAALEEQKRLANACVSLEQQCEERSNKLNAVRLECDRARMQSREVEDANAVLRQQYKEQTKKLNAAVEQKQKVEEEYHALRQKYEAQRNGYNTLHHKYRSVKANLEQRTLELQGAQRCLTTAGEFSGSEAVNSLRRLNEEVQKNTTFMAEWAIERFTLETPPADEMATRTIEQTRTSDVLGMKLMRLLGTKKHRDNSILVEMAFQAYLIYELYWIASQWSIGQEGQLHNAYINEIYQRMRHAEGQAVSGNWRALTRTFTLSSDISDPELGQKFQMMIISGFSEILLAAGCTASRADITSGLRSKFAEKIPRFVSLAVEVNKNIGVGVVSEDFEVQVVWPEADFDKETMEDSYDNGDGVQGTEEQKESVLCATELGLMQRRRVGPSTAESGNLSDLVIMKPKVALLSVIDMID